MGIRLIHNGGASICIYLFAFVWHLYLKDLFIKDTLIYILHLLKWPIFGFSGV